MYRIIGRAREKKWILPNNISMCKGLSGEPIRFLRKMTKCKVMVPCASLVSPAGDRKHLRTMICMMAVMQSQSLVTVTVHSLYKYCFFKHHRMECSEMVQSEQQRRSLGRSMSRKAKPAGLGGWDPEHCYQKKCLPFSAKLFLTLFLLRFSCSRPLMHGRQKEGNRTLIRDLHCRVEVGYRGQ